MKMVRWWRRRHGRLAVLSKESARVDAIDILWYDDDGCACMRAGPT